jgi:hypothetical protein
MPTRQGTVRVCVKFVPKGESGQTFQHCWNARAGQTTAQLRATALGYLRSRAGISYTRGKTISGRSADYDLEFTVTLGTEN